MGSAGRYSNAAILQAGNITDVLCFCAYQVFRGVTKRHGKRDMLFTILGYCQVRRNYVTLAILQGRDQIFKFFHIDNGWLELHAGCEACCHFQFHGMGAVLPGQAIFTTEGQYAQPAVFFDGGHVALVDVIFTAINGPYFRFGWFTAVVAAGTDEQ